MPPRRPRPSSSLPPTACSARSNCSPALVRARVERDGVSEQRPEESGECGGVAKQQGRVAFSRAAVRHVNADADRREIARLAEPTTQVAVSDALALDRRMRALGLDTPYVPVSATLPDYPKFRRYRNARYVFEPLDDRPPEL